MKRPKAANNEIYTADDAFTYKHVPLKKVGTIQVRYKTAQPLKPRRFTALGIMEEQNEATEGSE